MRGLWLESRVLRAREDVPRPGAAPGEALVRVSLTGVCGTDLELVKGYYPFAGVPGHEFVGRIEGGARDGERVVGEINASCGRCATCRAGRRTHCPTRTVLGIKARNGAMAEWLTLPLENLHAVPDHVPDEVAVFTEPVAAALQVQEQVAIGSGTRVLVIGAGRLGQLVARTLARADCVLTASGRHPRKLALLSELGIATCDVRDVPAGAADVVVECTGNPEGLGVARAAVRPGGTIVLKSTYHGEAGMNLSSVVVDEITLVGSRCGPFAPALALLASGALEVGDLIEARFALADGVAAFAKAEEPGMLKVLIAP